MAAEKVPKLEPTLSGVAGQYLVAAELSRRGFIATATLRNTCGVDILASNADGTKAITIQVKTNQRSKPTWMLSDKSETLISETLFYVFVSLNGRGGTPTYYIVDSATVAAYIRKTHSAWLRGTRKDGGKHGNTTIRIFTDKEKRYLDQWDRLGLD